MQGDFLICKSSPAGGKSIPRWYLSTVFQSRGSLTVQHLDQHPGRSSSKVRARLLYGALLWAHICPEVMSCERRKTFCLKFQVGKHILFLSSFFKIFSRKDDVDSFTISSYSCHGRKLLSPRSAQNTASHDIRRVQI